MSLGVDAVNGQEQPTSGASSSHLARGGELPKTLTGIRGLDEITRGGLPRGRPTLVCGGPGSGKTLLALTFLVNGALHFDEPGVLMTFEENEEEIASDVASLGFDLPELVKAQKLAVDYVRVERSEIEETGEYHLEGLFVRLDHAIRTVGARRVVLDTIESLFAGLKNDTILRSELRRLFRWLKDQGVTALITGERGDGALTRQGLEEYVSDAVILLDHRVHDQVSTRRLRVVKYRGSHHGTNEYPFLINANGISVVITNSHSSFECDMPRSRPVGSPRRLRAWSRDASPARIARAGRHETAGVHWPSTARGRCRVRPKEEPAMQLSEHVTATPSPGDQTYSLRLYVAGQTPKSVLAFTT